jgi:acyl-CoA synthetase (AMP-forming)/AMP-acid ligase II
MRSSAEGQDMDEHERPPTLLHALERHAGDRPDALACAWLNDVGASVASLTYGQLWRRIGVLAGELRSRASAGDRVVLLYGPGLEFVSAFLACLAAGVVAVPAYPPRNRRHHARLDAIVHDAQPALVLVGDVGVSRVDEWLAGLTVAPRRLDTGTVVSEGVDGPDLRLPDPAGLALLQYTSGSTATPKGVMVTHANIAHNSECLRRAFHLGAHSVGDLARGHRQIGRDPLRRPELRL